MIRTRPWLQHYGDVPETLDYPEVTVHEAVLRTARRRPDAVAWDFFGATATYRELAGQIEGLAAALAGSGVREGDRVTVSLPTSPQGVVAFYACSRLGAVPAMIHPLSTRDEIEHYLTLSGSRFAVTLDAFYDRFAGLERQTPLETLVLARIQDSFPALKRLAFRVTRGRKIAPVPADPLVRWWHDLVAASHPAVPAVETPFDAPATILYSGGTTGTPKGILLSHRNVVSEATQVATWVKLDERDTILAILPIFHGFGLGALVHTGLMAGARLLLVPTFTPELVAKLIRTKRPTLMAGVPTLYESLARDPSLRRADLSCLRAAFSGADTLQRPVKERFEQLVADRGGSVQLLEGYGLTEAVTAVMAMPLHLYREGTIGVPFPDMLVAVCDPASGVELPPGEEGELCIHGPDVMLGYLENPQATAETLRVHDDGRTWLHTGDLASMDEDGFFRFACRLKRMIKSSGMNVYPAQVEAVLLEHPAVAETCVVGIPDEAQGERVKAFVVPAAGHEPAEALAAELIAHCRERLIKWSCPRDVEFMDTLPETKLGKVDFTALQRAEREQALAGSATG